MSTSRRLERYASQSVILGTLGAILTGAIHLGMMTLPYNVFTHSTGFLLLIGSLVLAIVFAIWDFKQGLFVLNHMDKPHGRHAKPMAAVGIALSIVDFLPAVILLMLILQMLSFQFIPIQPLLDL